ncbi:MAG: LacI family DNA-binding transcriptional regulator [Bryobacteraceae bacterium]
MKTPEGRPERQTIDNGPVGIKAIAAALGTSIGTVDRALHSRPGINPITRSRVLQMAQKMGYKPNLAARYLKSQRQLLIAVHLPAEIAFFFDAIRQGIAEAAGPFEPALRVDSKTYPRLGQGDAALFKRALGDGAGGIIICPGTPAAVRLLIRKAARSNVPVVCVATDAPGTERLAAVTACPFTCGAVAAELLCRTARSPGPFALVTGSLETEDHAEKVEGFRSTMKVLDPKREIAAVIETHDDAQAAYSQIGALLRRRSDICGVYVGTANSLPVLQAIENAGRGGRIAVITTDLFPTLVPFIRSGQILATIDQRPKTQGRLALQALYQFLLDGKYPAPSIKVAPHIVMMSNLGLLAERLSAESEQGQKVKPRLR